MDVIAWLLEGDPAVRWQALRDLTGESPAAERARVAREGLGAQILARQSADGCWRHGEDPLWLPTLNAATLLHATGVDPADPAVSEAMERLAEGFHWHESFGAKGFFEGEVEPCINGRVLGLGAYFRRPEADLLQRLLGEQLEDGGWNCDAPRSSRSSFHTTICVLKGLLDHREAPGPSAAIEAALERGHEYLLARLLCRRRSTGALIDPAFSQFAFPERYHYDVLRGLDQLRRAGVTPDERVDEALAIVERKRQPDGRWLLDAAHLEGLNFAIGESIGAPSRWITLKALRVLRWRGNGGE